MLRQFNAARHVANQLVNEIGIKQGNQMVDLLKKPYKVLEQRKRRRKTMMTMHRRQQLSRVTAT